MGGRTVHSRDAVDTNVINNFLVGVIFRRKEARASVHNYDLFPIKMSALDVAECIYVDESST
jgi:hypothetical protein